MLVFKALSVLDLPVIVTQDLATFPKWGSVPSNKLASEMGQDYVWVVIPGDGGWGNLAIGNHLEGGMSVNCQMPPQIGNLYGTY